MAVTIALTSATFNSTGINVKNPPYNCVGNGVADDTACLQAALDTFNKVANKSGEIYIPVGVYKITSTLTYDGAPSIGLHIRGEVGGTRGPTGAQIIWYGPTDGTMMYFTGLNGSLLENFELYGRGLANKILHLDAFNTIIPGASGSSGNVLRRLTIAGMAGEESVGIAFGHDEPGTVQVSEVAMSDITMVGYSTPGTAYYGVKTFDSGNVKNYSFTGGTINGFRYGVDWLLASGSFTIRGTVFANTTVADVRTGVGNMHIDSVESETSNCMFVTGSTGSNPGSLVITNSAWESGGPSDDVIISYSGNLTLIGNILFNRRTGSSIPIVKLGGSPEIAATNQFASIISLNNWYQNASGYAPFIDGSGNTLMSTTGFYANKEIAVTSLGDTGGVSGGMKHLSNFIPQDVKRPTVRVFTDLWTAVNGTEVYCGDCVLGSNPCTGSGSGAIARRINNAWVC